MAIVVRCDFFSCHFFSCHFFRYDDFVLSCPMIYDPSNTSEYVKCVVTFYHIDFSDVSVSNCDFINCDDFVWTNDL